MKHKRSRKGTGRRRRGRGRKGRGKVGDFFKKANTWLKKTGVVSKVANTLGSAGVPYASTIGSVAGKLGYGRRRKRRHGKGPYQFDKPPFAHGRGSYRRRRGRGFTPGMGSTVATTYPIATSMALPRF